MEVIIHYGKTHVRFSRSWVLCVLTASLYAGNKKGNIGLFFTDNKEIIYFNKKYRGKNGPTDVLSFAGEMPHLGDILISVEYVQKRMSGVRRALKKEIGMLLIHGALHLCGFDHQTVKDERKMFGVQNAVARKIGVTEHMVY